MVLVAPQAHDLQWVAQDEAHNLHGHLTHALVVAREGRRRRRHTQEAARMPIIRVCTRPTLALGLCASPTKEPCAWVLKAGTVTLLGEMVLLPHLNIKGGELRVQPADTTHKTHSSRHSLSTQLLQGGTQAQQCRA